jgi:MFS family permease
VLAPLVVAIGRDLGASLSAVGLARSVMAATAVVVSLAIGPLIDRVGVAPLIQVGAALALAGAGLSALAPSLGLFYAAHVVTGAGVACLLSAGFAGIASYFGEDQSAWAVRSISGPMASDTSTAVAAITERARPTALSEAPRSRPMATISGASTTIEACVAIVARTSGRISRKRPVRPT